MPDINTVVVTPTVSVVAVNSSVPGSYDGIGRLSFGYISVKEYGAKGDGSTDDTTAIQNCVTAAVAAGLDVVFPKTGSYYKVTGTITVTGRCNLLGNALITTTSTTLPVFKVTGSNVAFQEGLRITGPSTHSSTQGTGKGIYVLGTSAASPATNILIRDVEVSGFNLYGVQMQWVDGFEVRNAKITECANTALGCLSTLRGRVVQNHIADIGNAANTYGIFFSRNETDSIVTEPLSADIICAQNLIERVGQWEGLDTHGGQRITFADNVVRGCYVGVNVGPSDNASNVITWAPTDVLATNNIIDSLVTNGTAGVGVQFTGVSSSVLATGSILGNLVRGHGTDTASAGNGCIRISRTQALRVAQNTLYEPSPIGVALVEYNTGFQLTDNTVVDAWSELLTVPSVAIISSDNNTGLIANNRLVTGTKSATHVNVEGVRLSGTSGNVITYGRNDFAAATTPYTNTSGLQTLGSESIKRTSVGDADATLTVGVTAETQVYADALTQNRTVTLATTDAYDGARFRVIRTGLGNFTLNVGGLKTIPSATAATVEVVFRAGAWQLASYGAL